MPCDEEVRRPGMNGHCEAFRKDVGHGELFAQPAGLRDGEILVFLADRRGGGALLVRRLLFFLAPDVQSKGSREDRHDCSYNGYIFHLILVLLILRGYVICDYGYDD